MGRFLPPRLATQDCLAYSAETVRRYSKSKLGVSNLQVDTDWLQTTQPLPTNVKRGIHPVQQEENSSSSFITILSLRIAVG